MKFVSRVTIPPYATTPEYSTTKATFPDVIIDEFVVTVILVSANAPPAGVVHSSVDLLESIISTNEKSFVYVDAVPTTDATPAELFTKVSMKTRTLFVAVVVYGTTTVVPDEPQFTALPTYAIAGLALCGFAQAMIATTRSQRTVTAPAPGWTPADDRTARRSSRG